MKWKSHKTQYGPIVHKDYGYKDLLPNKVVQRLSKAQVFEHINPYHVKNNVKKAKWRTGKYLYQLMWKVIIDNVMEGNQISLPYGGKVYIGVVGKTHSKYANLHSYGKVYGLKITLPGGHHGYHFKMNRKRRNELASNIKAGKTYHNY